MSDTQDDYTPVFDVNRPAEERIAVTRRTDVVPGDGAAAAETPTWGAPVITPEMMEERRRENAELSRQVDAAFEAGYRPKSSPPPLTDPAPEKPTHLEVERAHHALSYDRAFAVDGGGPEARTDPEPGLIRDGKPAFGAAADEQVTGSHGSFDYPCLDSQGAAGRIPLNDTEPADPVVPDESAPDREAAPPTA